MNTEKNYYAVLGILPEIDDVAIAPVFRALLKKYHPDVFKGSKREAERRTREIIEAYEVLANPHNRKAYDSARKVKRSSEEKGNTGGFSGGDAARPQMGPKEAFYQKLEHALRRSSFRLRTEPSGEEVIQNRSALSSLIKKLVNSEPASFNREVVQKYMNEVQQWAKVVGFKYLLDQPIVAAVVEGDKLAEEEAIEIVNRFDKIVFEMLKFASKINGFSNSTGIILFVFFDHACASEFIQRTRDKCKIWALSRKSYVLPWVIDVTNKDVSRHDGLPFLHGVLSQNYLQKSIFQQ